MIATCPHCKNGFYIVPDMAGEVVTCSKCKKKVRAPDRRGQGGNAPKPPDDGIPIAIIEETREEIEERLKIEAEARVTAETRLAEIEEAKVKAEDLSRQRGEKLAQLEKELKELAEAKTSLMERLKTIGEVKADGQKTALIEAEIAAREKAEGVARELESKIITLEEQLQIHKAAVEQAQQQLRDAERQITEAQQKYQQEARAHQTTQQKLASESQTRAGVEARLNAEIEKRTKADNELRNKTDLAEKFEKHRKLMEQLESQLKAETSARLRTQAQLEQEVEKRNKMQKEVAMMQMRTETHQETRIVEQPMNYQKGVLRLVLVLSVMAAIAGGIFEYYYGYANYIINRYFDKSSILEYVNQPHLVPINLLLFGVAGFIAVWVLYLPVRFVLKGFGSKTGPSEKIAVKKLPVETQGEIKPQFSHGMWRS
jgi:hypothetical protein